MGGGQTDSWGGGGKQIPWGGGHNLFAISKALRNSHGREKMLSHDLNALMIFSNIDQ